MERQLYLYDYVDVPFPDVVSLLEGDPHDLLRDATEAARSRTDEHTKAELVVHLGHFEIGREVDIKVGGIRRPEDTRIVLPLSWHAVQHAALFPSLSADLEVAALAHNPPLTQITLAGEYEPPLGAVGAAGDAMIGHRFAEAALHEFLRKLVVRIAAISQA